MDARFANEEKLPIYYPSKDDVFLLSSNPILQSLAETNWTFPEVAESTLLRDIRSGAVCVHQKTFADSLECKAFIAKHQDQDPKPSFNDAPHELVEKFIIRILVEQAQRVEKEKKEVLEEIIQAKLVGLTKHWDQSFYRIAEIALTRACKKIGTYGSQFTCEHVINLTYAKQKFTIETFSFDMKLLPLDEKKCFYIDENSNPIGYPLPKYITSYVNFLFENEKLIWEAVISTKENIAALLLNAKELKINFKNLFPFIAKANENIADDFVFLKKPKKKNASVIIATEKDLSGEKESPAENPSKVESEIEESDIEEDYLPNKLGTYEEEEQLLLAKIRILTCYVDTSDLINRVNEVHAFIQKENDAASNNIEKVNALTHLLRSTTKLVLATSAVLEAGDDKEKKSATKLGLQKEIEHYKNEAKKIGKFSWGTFIKASMMALIGCALSLTPIGLPFGFASLCYSGILFYRAFNSPPKSMQILTDECEKHAHTPNRFISGISSLFNK